MKKRIVAVILCIALFNTPIYAAKPSIDVTDGEAMSTFFQQVMDFTENQYRFDVTKEGLYEKAIENILKNHPEMFDELMKGAYGALDVNSRYLTSAEYSKQNETLSGKFFGIGMTFSDNNGTFIVGSTIKGSPAEASQILPGDIIVSVDGKDINGMYIDDVIDMIRGEKGTTVTLGLIRNDIPITVNVTREEIVVNPVSYHKLDKNNAGYVNISTFNGNTAECLTDALNDLSSQGVDKIILDLRNNLGGYMDQAIKVASNFVPDNALVVSESYKNKEEHNKYYAIKTEKKFKVVVLVNEYSASASEIVSGAIQDNKCGVLVGRTTFGKGTVQAPIQIKNAGGIVLTVAQYHTPSGACIHGIGLTPDYPLRNEMVNIDISKFKQLTGERVLQIGDHGDDVLAVKQRLNALGYAFNNMDDVYDTRLSSAVANFQSQQGLFSYGVMDFTTQFRLAEVVANTLVETDDQLEKAKELIYTME